MSRNIHKHLFAMAFILLCGSLYNGSLGLKHKTINLSELVKVLIDEPNRYELIKSLASDPNKFSHNRFCRKIAFSQKGKNDCLVNLFGFKPSSKNLIRIAVVDTGIDKTHPYLNPYVYPRGYDLTYWNQPFLDEEHHGTHVSGIIVQQIEELSDKNKTIVPFELISFKYYKNKLIKTEAGFQSSIQSILSNERVDIINISGGGNKFVWEEEEALKKAMAAGIQVVTAAGNEYRNLDLNPWFPCAYQLQNIICVGSINPEQNLLDDSSNFGDIVDVAVVGKFVYSTIPGNRWGLMSGTSMATPKVTALLAYGLAKNHKKYTRTTFSILTDPVSPRDYLPVRSIILDVPKSSSRVPTSN